MNKRLILSLLCCFALSSCTIVNQLRLRNSNDHLEPIWSEKVVQSSLLTEYDGEKPYVYATINGVGGFKFLVDTGASITILQDTAKVKALGLERGYDLAIGGWGDEEDSPAYQSQLKQFKLKDVYFEEVNIAYLPVTQSKYYLRPDEAVFDGIIGHDLMKHFSWTFDKRANQITIHSESQKVIAKTSLPIDVFFGKLYINSSIDLGKDQVFEHELIIDTGSRHYLKLNEMYLSDHEYMLPSPSITAADFGVSGRAIHQRITVPQLGLGELKFDHVKANIIKSDDDDNFWVIGSALMNQFITVIDYPTETLHIIEYPESTFKSKYNLLGLELRKILSGEFVVRYVFPDIVSNSSDIKEGDLITSINGIKSQDISLEDWLKITASAGEHQICRQRVEVICTALMANPIEGYSQL